MDDRESLDRSSAEVAQSMPVSDSNVEFLTAEGSSESDRAHPGNESSGVEVVLRSDVCYRAPGHVYGLSTDYIQIGINTLLTRLKQSVASARVSLFNF